ncbi:MULTISPECIES: glycine cleavage system protein GcvH [Mycolicibacter]|uniref:Glycine cleavage system H protein n=2 Tax=Mycolicibacter TaxID=1073531 RepID=A0A1X1TLZ6_9MYCO|nr:MULTISPECIES: glycine cleavage system protein GcvH [Mycolicibacter]MCV7084443.1 glycine cleavage system protein GcvH [Mycolicibacter hiberniae]ORV45570.1 glycine cleavage system protein H [Mycolicibacter engbaekii]ORV67532.1 glycine cleavage system protein H [Mycolicibacter hiberniae]BBZ22979.1 glycine cleavage system H protein [Mycolicibacter hiberniae]
MSSESLVPADLYYTAEHEWVRRTGPDTVQVGITDFAQAALGDVVFVQLPAAGTGVSAGEPFGEVESTKSVSDLYAPITASVSAVNAELDANPQLVNSDPYGAGWLVELQVANADSAALEQSLSGLLSADAYRATLSE